MARYDDDDVDISRGRRNNVPVPNYLVQSILVTLCCCLPFGIVAIVNAAKVNGLAETGRYDEAVAASESAKKWCWIGFGLGIVAQIIGVAIQIMVAMQQQGGR